MNHEVLTDSITGLLMEELLDCVLSDMLLHGQVALCSSQLKRMKKEVLESAKCKTASQGMGSPGAGRLLHVVEMPNPLCRTASTSPVPAREVSDGYDDYDPQNYQSYFDFTTAKCSSPAVINQGIHKESFKVTSKRLVDKYVEEILETPGFLCSSNLLKLYASGGTLSLILGEQSLDDREREEQLYGKMLLEALCECLDKKYLRFCLPSFFLFLQPCPEGPYLKQTLVSKVNEHADAACEGGFSLEYILEKSLEEEDWKTPYHEMMEVLQDISEHVMMDMIDSISHDLMEIKHLTCGSQVTTGFTHSAEWQTLCC